MLTKTCHKCKTTKSVNEFGRNKSRADGLQSQCKACKKATQKSWYERNKKAQAARRRKQKERGRAYIRSLKKSPCVDCDNTYPYYVMDFDHLGDKSFALANVNGQSIETIKQELAKCELVCANCHRVRTHNRRGS